MILEIQLTDQMNYNTRGSKKQNASWCVLG